MSYIGLLILAIGIFASISLSAVSHVFLLIPSLYFTYKFIKERPFTLSPSFWALIVLILSIILSVLVNYNEIERPLKAISKIKYFLIPLLSVPTLYYLKESYLTEKKKKTVFFLFILSTTIATISGLIGLKTGFNPIKMKPACHDTRACGLYGMYMTYGYGISLFISLISGIFLNYKGDTFLRDKKFFVPIFLINFTGLILSLARGAWIGFAASTPFLALKNLKLTLSIIGGTIFIAIIAFYSSENIRDTILKRATSNVQRIGFYQTAYYAFTEKPIFGWGYRNFEPNTKKLKVKYNIPFPEFGSHAHNNILEHLASTGAFGVIALLAFFIIWGREVWISSKYLFPFFINFFVSGQVQYTFGDGENLFLIMFIWSVTSLLYSLDKDRKTV